MAAPDQYQYEAGYDYDYDEYEYEDDEDMPATERELAEDAQWKLIQKNTFTRWANEHLKTVSKNIADLEGDFADGLRLLALVEVLSGKKFKKINKRPNFRTQKLENVTMCMKFLEEEEGIRIVNIDSTDIVDSKLKLILGLIWTLILHYSISMPVWEEEDDPDQKERTPKQRLLQWVQSKVPDKPIKNFTSDWNDGRAIGALVDAVAPGMCPDWEDWDPRAAKKNATEAMNAAEEWLSVPQLITPEDMIHPKVDELSMMTYLSQFPNAKLKPGAPLRPRTNAARVRAYGPGIEPTGNCVGASARFIVETFSAGRGDVEVLVLDPHGQQIPCEVVFNNDRNLTYSCVYTPHVEGQYRVLIKFAGREIPKSPYCVMVDAAPGDASKCHAQGPGIEKTGNMVNKKTYFEIFTTNAGVGVVDVAVLDPHGRKDTVRPTVNKQGPEVWYCEYTPVEEGLHSVNVFYAGKAIPNSPFPVSIAPDGGAPIEPSKVGPATSAPPVDGARATMSPVPRGGRPMVPPQHGTQPPAAPNVPIQAAPTGKPLFKEPERPADPKKCYCSGRGIQPKGVRVGDQADFKVHTEGAGTGECKVQVIGPGGVNIPCRVKQIGQNLYECVYAPQQPGNYVINVTYATQHVTKSPFKVAVGPFKDSRIRAYGPGLLGGVVGYPALFTVETNGETGALGFSIEGPSQAKIDCKDNGDGSADITYWPTAPGEYAVHILCNEEDIPKSPYMAQVIQRGNFDPTKVLASGPGLEKEGNVVNRWAEFVVDARAAGKAPLQVSCVDVDLMPVEVVIKDNHDGTYACRYMPRNNTKHVVSVTWGSVSIPNSPFRVFVSEASNPGKVRVYGPAVEQPVKTFTPTHLVVDCSKAGPGDVAIALTDERGVDVAVRTTDMKDNTFRIDFEPQTAGPYMCSVFFAEQEVPSSPYKIKVEPSVDVSKVKVEGLENRVFMEATTDFIVNAQALQRTGSGKVRALIVGPSGSRTEALTTNNHDGTYKCMYTPVEQGPTKVEVTYEGLALPNSPFNVSVVTGCDPSRVRAYGPGLEGGYTNRPQTFTVETRGAGQGGLGLAVEGPSEAKMTCCDNRDGSCTVEYFPTKPGDYEITIKFAEQHIPGSVFHVPMVAEINPAKVRCYGPGVDPKGVKLGEPAAFVVDASEAGEAPLEVVTTDQQGRKRPAQITPRGQGVYDCVYYPEVEGNMRVDVNYASQKVPSSPYNVRVHPSWDASKVKVTGDGVKPHGVKASLPARFRVDTRAAGFAPLDVLIQDPEGRNVQPTIADNGDGTYNVSYVPEDVGMYHVTTTFGGQHVPGSPFKVQTVPTGRAGMVKLPDDIPSTIPVNEECVIQVNMSGAGEGNVTCRIRSNSDSDVDIDIVDNGDGTVSLMYTPRVPGAYTLNIKFGGQPVPNGEFTQMAEEDFIQPNQMQGVHSAPPSDGAGNYHPVDFCIPVGPIFNFVSAVVTQPSGRKAYPKIEDNKDGTVTIRYNPTETGLHELAINYNNQAIQGSPFKFHVDAIDSGFVTAYGPGLSHGISAQPAHFTIVTKDAGAGGLSLAVEGPSKAEIQCVDNKDGSCSVSYVPTMAGEYNIIIKFADKHISGSPFTAKVTSPTGDQKRAMLSVGSSSEVSLKVTETDIGNLTATIRSPSGIEEPCILKRLANGHLGISFTPREIGEHLVNVYRQGQHIPNSPFKIYVGESEIGNASKVKVTGRGCVEGMANQVNEFTINTKEAGYGGLSLSIEGPSKADIECHDNEDGSCRVTYKPTEPGNYIVNVKFADEHVPGSPFLVKIGGEPSGRVTERITRQREAADVTHIGSQCELSLKIPGTSPYDMEASVMAPSGVTEMCEILDLQDGHYSIKFVPKEMGIHTVSVRHKGIHIPGSPFQFTVGPITDGGAHKVRALGPGLERAVVNKPADFNIYTREAGAGGLSIAIEGPSKAEIDFQDRKDGSCGVTYCCSEPGEYLASVKFNDMHIPDSPFKVYISPSSVDAQKLTIQSLQEQGLQINKPASFTVDFNGAQGKLDARVVAPSGAEDEAILQEVDKDRYAVRFIPHENGIHYIHVRLNGSHIPGSPFRVLVGQQDADPSRVRAHGEGLSRGRTGQQCKFIVNTVNAGSGALAVTVDGPSKVQLNCREVEEGYEFTYTPTAPGDYLITIKYAGNTHIPGSPFKARIEGGVVQQGGWTEQSQVVVETVTKSSTTQAFAALQHSQHASDAAKVVAHGMGLKKAMLNKETTFSVDCSKASLNMLMVGVMGPHHPCEQIKITHKGNNQYTVSYMVKDRGDYVMFVKWGEDHVPGSPFHITVQ